MKQTIKKVKTKVEVLSNKQMLMIKGGTGSSKNPPKRRRPRVLSVKVKSPG